MPEKIKYKLKHIVGKRQFYRRVALTVRKTFQACDKKPKVIHKNISLHSVNENNNGDALKNNMSNILHGNVSLNSKRENNDALENNISSSHEEQTSLSLMLSENNILVSSNLNRNLVSTVSQPCLNSSLRQWAINFNVTHSAITGLLHILNFFHHELPLDSRTLLETPRNIKKRKLNNGEFCYFGLKNILKIILSQIPENFGNKLDISFNIDGLPLFNSSNLQFWPILGLIKNFKSNPFAIGIFCGRSKPQSLELFLEDFVDELLYVLQEGFEVNNKRYHITIHSFVCDAPARAFIKCIKSHTGYSCCEKCVIPGQYIQNRVVFKDISAPKRTNNSFANQQDEDHHTGSSPLLKLKIGMVTDFPIDYMHACCLGVMRKLLNVWISGALATRLSGHKVNILSEHLESLKPYIPLEFNRKPRTLYELPRWKATEFRTFLLYLGSFVLKNIIDRAVYEHYLLFHTAISILISAKLLSKFSCAFPQELLNVFVKHCEQLYGQTFLIYNVHILCHLADDVKNYGLLDLFSCFPFENYLGQIKNLIKSPNYPLQQIGRRLHEINAVLQNNLPTIAKQSIHSIEHNSGQFPEKFRNVFCKQFKQIKHGDFTICTNSHSSANSYCLMRNNILVQVQNIIVTSQETFIVGRYFTAYDSLYKYPLDSKELNIYVTKNLSHKSEILSSHDIIAKCIVFPSDDSWVSFPIIHTY